MTIIEGHITPDLKWQYFSKEYEFQRTEDMLDYIQKNLSKLLVSKSFNPHFPGMEHKSKDT